jgi:hypothetical protein
VLGEPLTTAIVAAFVLILAGSVLATSAGQTSSPPARETPQARLSQRIRPVMTERARLDSPE